MSRSTVENSKKNDPRDVRMRGFQKRVTVETALKWVDENAVRLGDESIGLRDAVGRVLAEDVIASIDVPSFDRAAMDGYAIRGDETTGASDYNPLSFPIVGESLPGNPFESNVEAGSAVRIMTGAPVPSGVDAVVPAEYVTESDGVVQITTSVAPRKHVGATGEDITSGTKVLNSGRRLRPQDVGLLASLGFAEVAIVREPSVRLIITGNELIEPGQPRTEHQIFESNSYVLDGLIKRDSSEELNIRYIADDRALIGSALTEPGADVILVSGGSSVGAEDHAPTVVAEHGELAIHGIAMRPSSPTGMGRIGNALVFLLPGNPVSCMCAYDFFAGRAIRQMSGRVASWPYVRKTGIVRSKIASAIGRVDYCRVRIVSNEKNANDGHSNAVEIEPVSLSGASILSSTTRADGFIIVPADCEGYATDSCVDVYLYDPVN